MTAVIAATATATFLAGIVFGLVFHYLVAYKPLRRGYEELVEHILTMRKQGFVPQFEFDQVRQPDPSEDIMEF